MKKVSELRKVSVLVGCRYSHHAGIETYFITAAFAHLLTQIWRGAQTICGQRAVEVIHCCGLECDRGSGQSLQVLFAQGRAGRCAKPAGPAGRAELHAFPRWRWQGGEKFHRSADGQEDLTANC